MTSVLFINRVYPPSNGATGEMLRDLAVGLVSQGVEVTILCMAERGTVDERIDGVRVVRIGGVFSRRNTLLRAAAYVFMIPSLLVRALLMRRTDAVVTMTDPPMLAVLGPMIAFFKRNRIIHWAQDLYPEVAEELGVLPRGSAATRLLREVSSIALRHSDAVVSIGRCMTARLRGRGVVYGRIREIPNWAPPVAPVPPGENKFRASLGIGDAFVVAYSGNMGLAHEFDAVLDAASLLSGRRGVFLMIGGGPRRADVEAEALRRGLGNMRFLPPQPRGDLAESLSAADAHLVTMRANLCGLVVPSKFYGVLAAGRPCLFVGPGDSEVARVIKESGAGRVLDPGDGEGLAAAIAGWMDDPASHVDACRNASEVGAEATSEGAVRAFGEMLESLR
jgi:colanic acid biosynthesis glycosyl transferase WcaI